MFVYAGKFTEARGSEGAEGIVVYRFDGASGALEQVGSVRGLISPTFVALGPGGDVLYAVERQWTPEDAASGAVAALAIDPASGVPLLLNRVPSGGASPCHVSVHPGGRLLFAAHYASGHVAAFPLGADGRVGGPSDVVRHEGHGPHPERQEGPHAHFIAPDPAGAFVLACDLGVDRIMVYRLDQGAGKLVPGPVPFAQVASGAGARHLAFHPGGWFAYVINELDSTIAAFAYDAERGALRIVQTVSTVPPDFGGENAPAQLLVHPAGRFVYGSNRGHDSIAIFAVDGTTGRLRLMGHEPTGGAWPRNFNIDPSGRFLLVANERSGTIISFRIDPGTGRLEPTGHAAETPSPTCIVFRPA